MAGPLGCFMAPACDARMLRVEGETAESSPILGHGPEGWPLAPSSMGAAATATREDEGMAKGWPCPNAACSTDLASIEDAVSKPTSMLLGRICTMSFS